MMFITSWSSLIFVGFLSTAKASKDCTPKPTDLVFVLDESGSVGDINFQLQNQFVAKLVEGFDIGINNTQVAVITFSSEVVVEFYLNAIHDKQQLLESIKHINYSHSGLTMTHRALNSVRNDVFTVANGMRPDALHFVIVLTDGRSMSSRATINEAKLLGGMNITVFAIGISNEVNEVELRGLASDPKDVIIVKDFDSLMSIRNQALNGACEALKKRDNDYNSMKVTTDTVFEISTGSLATATMTSEAPTIGSTKPTTTCFEEKYQSFNLIAHSSSYDFDFENVSSCNLLLKLPNSNTSWIIGNETTITEIRNATNNHAFQNAFGQFAYVDGSSMQPNNTACISTQTMHSALKQTICLQFYFQMFGNDTKTLKVYKTNGSLSLDDATCIWQESMMSTYDWSFAQAEFNLSSTGRIVFEAMSTPDGNGFAIDNITLSAWQCPRFPESSIQSQMISTKASIKEASTTDSSTTPKTPRVSDYSSTGNEYWTDFITGTPSIQPQMLSRQASTKKAPTTDSSTSPPTAIFPAYSSTYYGYWTDYSSFPLSKIETNAPETSTKAFITSTKTTTKTTTSDQLTYPVVKNVYSSTDNVYWTESSSLPPNIVFHSRKPSTQPYRTSSQTTQTTTRTTTSDPPTMHPVAIPTYSSTDNVYWTDSSSSYPSNFAIFGQGTSTLTSEKSTKTSTIITNAFNAILLKTTPTRTSKSHTTKKIVTTNPVLRTTKHSNKNTGRFTSKLISNIRTTTPSGERTSTSVLNNKLSHPHSRFSIPGYFQFIEVGLIAITAIVCMGLLGCCCLKFCGGKRSEDDDEDEKKEKEVNSIPPAWKENHRNPISKPNRWTDDF